MSGAEKKVADVAFKAGEDMDWGGMAELLVPEEARCAFDEVNTQLQTKFSQEPEPVDWVYYRKYDEVQIPMYVDNVTPQYKPKFDALELPEEKREDPVCVCAGAICQLQKQVTELQEQLAIAQADILNMQSQHSNLMAFIYMEIAQSINTVDHTKSTFFVEDTFWT